jgi:HEPN domain-containing protein
MCDREHAQQLLAMAKRDLKAASAMTDKNVFPDEIAGFLFQQTMEKALKAWLALLGVEYPKTHDISLLLKRLGELKQDVERYYSLVDLTSFAVQFRYEEYNEENDPLNRLEIVREIEYLIEVIEGSMI